MSTGTPPVLMQNSTDALRQRVYLLVAALATVSQVAVLGLDLVRGTGFHWESIFGIVLCGALIPFLLRNWVSIQQLDYGVLLFASLGVAVQLLGAFHHIGLPPTRLYFVVVFLFVAAFSILPALYAVLYSTLLFGIFAALVLPRGGDATMLVELGVIVMLVAHLSIFGQRVSAERAETRVMQALASTDTLTGLPNRRAMYDRIEEAFAHVPKGRHSALLLLDVDHFKNVNDTHGHTVGDLVLQRFASVLQNAARSEDGVSRWGGEEFLILISGVGEPEAIESAHRFLDEIRKAEMHQGIQVTASCGVAHSTSVTSTAEWLVQADERLYVAKNAGRDQAHPPRRV